MAFIKNMKIYITGISGTGKTTITKELNKKGIKAYDLDEVPNLCNWFNRKTGKIVDCEVKLDRPFIESHKWVCDIELLKQLTNNDELVVILGNADNREEVSLLFDKIILLQCSPEVFLQRIKQRDNNDFGQDKSAQEYLLDTYEEFQNYFIKEGAIPINAEEELSKVSDNIISEIRK
jgi:dephospho-CoA kinase